MAAPKVFASSGSPTGVASRDMNFPANSSGNGRHQLLSPPREDDARFDSELKRGLYEIRKFEVAIADRMKRLKSAAGMPIRRTLVDTLWQAQPTLERLEEHIRTVRSLSTTGLVDWPKPAGPRGRLPP